MTARRLLASLTATVWLLPAALAGGVALHVALEHGHGDGHSAGHHDAAHAAALVELLEHGHAHAQAGADSEAEHEHRVVASGSVVVRRAAAASPSAGSALAADFVPVEPTRPTGLAASPPVPPPRGSGAPLLALLAVLRI